MANAHKLFVTVTSPQGFLIASKTAAVGQMNFQTEVTGTTIREAIINKNYIYTSCSCGNCSFLPIGFYRMCLGNHNNQFGGIRVFLNFGVIYEGFEDSKKEMEEGEEVLNSTLANIEVFVSIQVSGILDFVMFSTITISLNYVWRGS